MSTAIRHDDLRDPPIIDEVRELFSVVDRSPDRWLRTPHEMLGGETPLALIRGGRESEVRDLLAAIRFGAFT